MIENAVSETALVAARLRAAHQVIDGAPRILNDPIAIGLVPGSSELELLNEKNQLAAPFLKTLRASFVLRSRVTEEALHQAVRAGTNQYVILGAGFDTFAYRQPLLSGSEPHPFNIFEVDHPATQSAKQDHLNRAKITLPENLKLCAVDFERDRLANALLEAGFDRDGTTFYSWLGVIPYLTVSAVHEMFLELRSLGRNHSIALSYVLPDAELADIDAQTVEISSAAAAARGEAWVSRFSRLEIDALLRKAGYESIRHVGPDEYAELLTTNRSDGLPVPGFEQVAIASTHPRSAPA